MAPYTAFYVFNRRSNRVSLAYDSLQANSLGGGGLGGREIYLSRDYHVHLLFQFNLFHCCKNSLQFLQTFDFVIAVIALFKKNVTVLLSSFVTHDDRR